MNHDHTQQREVDLDLILYRPSLDSMKRSNLMRFIQYLQTTVFNSTNNTNNTNNNSNLLVVRPAFLDMRLEDDPVALHHALYQWSIQDKQFWIHVWNYLNIQCSEKPVSALAPVSAALQNEQKQNATTVIDFFNAEFFPGARCNYAQNLMRLCFDPVYRDRDAMVALGEDGIPGVHFPRRVVTYGQLHDRVAKLTHSLRQLGLKKMDRVVALMPNTPETLIFTLAVTAIGAVWSSVSPELGKKVVCDRFEQVTPVMLVACEHYTFNGKVFHTASTVEYLMEHIPTLTTLVHVPNVQFVDDAAVQQEEQGAEPVLYKPLPRFASVAQSIQRAGRSQQQVVDYDDQLLASGDSVPELLFEQLPVQHPVFIMYTSGTTGAPKCIVQGFGVLVNHLKELLFHCDDSEQDTVFVYTNSAWMMWHWSVGLLYIGSKIILFDGSPIHSDKALMWRIIEREGVTHFGTSSRYLSMLHNIDMDFISGKSGHCDLSKLRLITTTGSPLAPSVAIYIYEKIKSDVQLSSISGGTEINGCFALGSPLLPVYPAELQSAGFGMNLQVWSEQGTRIFAQNGELVCLNPFPSAPLYFWGDEENKKYRDSYFGAYDNIWTHGDLAEQTKRLGFYIKGRSDSTLNPGGVRIGTSDFYGTLDLVKEVEDSVVVGQRESDGNERIVLFVQLKSGEQFTKEVRDEIIKIIRNNLSPRHMPSVIASVTAVPYNVNGKKLEKLVKKLVCCDLVNPNEMSSIKTPVELLEEFKPENWNTIEALASRV